MSDHCLYNGPQEYGAHGCGGQEPDCWPCRMEATIERLERDMASAAMVIGQREATIERLRAALERIGNAPWTTSKSELKHEARQALAATPASEPCACERETAEGVNPQRIYTCPQHQEPLEVWKAGREIGRREPCPDCERNAPVLEAVREWYALLSGEYWGQEMLPEETALCAAARAAGLGEE